MGFKTLHTDGRSVTLIEVSYTRLSNNYNKGDFMIGYPITYGDTLEEGNGFTSETLFTEISEYCSNEKTQENFCKGYKFGLLFFGVASLLVSSTPAFAEAEGSLTTSGSNSGTVTNNGAGSCPGAGSGPSSVPAPTPGPPTLGSLANVPTADRGVYAASALGICGIAMKTGAFYVGFICAAAVLVGVRMAGVSANAAM